MENEHIQEDTNIQTQKVPIRVAITHGDTNGVGYELIFKTFEENNIFDICTPIVYGSAKIATYHRKAIDSNTNFYVINSADEARDGQLNLVNCFDQEIVVTLGHPSEEAGLAALIAIIILILKNKAKKEVNNE